MAGSAFGAIDDVLLDTGAMPGEQDDSILPEGAIVDESGAILIPDGEGGFDIEYPDDEDDDDLSGSEVHSANLADWLDENYLNLLGQQLCEAVELDKSSREEWERRLAKGIELVGVAEEAGEGPFKGASRVVHPVLAEAIVQFQSRAIAELFPATGPAKGVVIGKSDEEKVAQAKRLEDYLNYQYTMEMPEAFNEMDQLLMWLPLEGSVFKKVYADPLRGRMTAEMVRAGDLIVNYSARSLERASRFTHVIPIMRNDLLKQMRSGFYREIDLEDPDMTERSRVKEEIDKTEGREPDAMGILGIENDYEHEVYEVFCDWDLPKFEDLDPETGEPTGIALPYIVSIEKDTQKVLSIRRNWRDPSVKNWPWRNPADMHQKRIYFVHYKFLPGLGFYGYGFLHTIGGLAKAATGALRQLLDSGKFANLQGGFKSKDAKIPGGNTSIAPGEWKDIETPADDMSKSFFPLPYKEPSKTLFELLGFVVESAQRFASTTESMVGDADNKGPVGTTVALIEQGSKVFSAIHKRCHKAQGDELRMMAEGDYEIMLQSGIDSYPYEVEGESREIMLADFDGRVDVAPVSDPNIFSATQRIAQAQSILQMTLGDPQSPIDKREAYRRMLEALRVDDIESLLPDRSEVQRMDPLTENMALMFQKPIRAYPDQDHAAHMQVHGQWFMGLPPEGQKLLMPVHMAHLAEHMAWQYRNQIQMVLAQQGIQLPPPPDFHSESGMVEGPELPPEIENEVAAMVAQAVQILGQQMGGAGGAPPDPETMKAKAEIARKDAEAQQKMELQQREFDAEQARKAQEFEFEQNMRGMELQADIAMRDVEMSADMQARQQEMQVEQDRANRAEMDERGRAARAEADERARLEREARMAEEAHKAKLKNDAEAAKAKRAAAAAKPKPAAKKPAAKPRAKK